MKILFVVMAVNISCMSALAQAPSDTSSLSKKTRYVLPDGSVVGIEKLDSLNKAWGQGRVGVMHTQADDEKGIVRVVRITDEMMQKSKDRDDRNKAVIMNKPAPDFALTDLQGNRLSLKKLRGKIVVLNFWFTSCTPCIHEMPELNELVKAYDGKNVAFLGLTYNSAEQVKTFLKKRSFSYTLLPGSHEVDKKYQISSWPTSIVIDKKGDVKMIVYSDPKIREKLETVINSLKELP